jgi:hypothetical protein
MEADEMQLNFSLTPETFRAVTATLSEARLARYLPAADGDPRLAFELYLWNARICEAFYLPCQIMEVACRNAIARAVADRFGAAWFRHDGFQAGLPSRLREEMGRAVAQEGARHGDRLAADHVIGSLTFGFWVHLLTKGFEHTLWRHGMGPYFPHAPPGVRRVDLHQRIDRGRMFRNRIAHHEAVFDKRPAAEASNIGAVVGWVCLDTQWVVGRTASVSRVINLRPRLGLRTGSWSGAVAGGGKSLAA